MKYAALRITSKGFFHNKHIEKVLMDLEQENKLWMWYKVDKRGSIPQPCKIDYIVHINRSTDEQIEEIRNRVMNTNHVKTIISSLEVCEQT